jgi:hypothetical protein
MQILQYFKLKFINEIKKKIKKSKDILNPKFFFQEKKK